MSKKDDRNLSLELEEIDIDCQRQEMRKSLKLIVSLQPLVPIDNINQAINFTNYTDQGAVTEDVSSSGLGLIFDEPLETGTYVKIRAFGDFSATGRVTYCQKKDGKSRLGICFIEKEGEWVV